MDQFGANPLGFNQREFLQLFLLDSLSRNSDYPRSLYTQLNEQFPDKVHSYAYLCKVSNEMANEGLVEFLSIERKNYLVITDAGKERYQWFKDNYQPRLIELKKVVDRFIFDLTGSGTRTPVEHSLPNKYRRYFSKLVSVKDLVRYVTLKQAQLNSTIYMGQIRELLLQKYGWESSNSYLYDVLGEMLEEVLLISEWETEKRTKRRLRITDKGLEAYNRFANDAQDRLLDVRNFLNEILNLLDVKEG